MWTSPEFSFDTEPLAFHTVAIEDLPHAQLVHENVDLLEDLPQLKAMSSEDRLAFYKGEKTGYGIEEAIATLYAGHQFGYFNPQLGDGRAAIVATDENVPISKFFPQAFQDLVNDFIHRKKEQGNSEWAFDAFDFFEKPTSVELQLKGSGITPYSRRGDGKAVLRSSVREYLASEAVYQLGIPSTRAVALVHDAQTPVYRETRESAAMVLRVAPSFLRLGHLEYWGRHGYAERLTPYIAYLFRTFFKTDGIDFSPVQQLQAVLTISAILNAVTMAQWQGVGFCHGVLNSDNISLLGMTLDYGPYGFLDAFDMGHICNHSDHGGRYAYKNQPAIGLWNYSRLLEACQDFVGNDEDYQALKESIEGTFQDAFNTSFLAVYRQKLRMEDRKLIPDIEFGEVLKSLLAYLHQNKLDYTRFFTALPAWETAFQNEETPHVADIERLAMGIESHEAAWWLHEIYAPYLQKNALSGASQTLVNPTIVLRNHIAQALIEDAEANRFDAFAEGFTRLQTPFEDAHHAHDWAKVPPASAKEICVSCSS
ncbi:MAG: protein adenylyltransferase SelO family protein [Vampirovibrionales bacterium]